MKPIIVTVTDEALPDIRKLADQLSQKGMKVDSVLPITGVITGSLATAKASVLRKVRGVLSVEDELVAKLPPSDSTLQ